MYPEIKIISKTKMRNTALETTKLCSSGGSIAQWLAYLLPALAAPGLIPSAYEFFRAKIVMLLSLINGTARRKWAVA